MTDFQLTTPVAFIIFNRPDTTARVFAEIARARPPKLLVVGDGARASREGEAAKVAAARAIINQVDWPCEVLTNYSETNLGCKVRVSSGLDWVFEQVEECIILEDDCLPHPTFFRFCQELLIRYRYDQRISMISGDNYLFNSIEVEHSYYFTKYSNIWGWASWRRAWNDYDVTLRYWPEFEAKNGISYLSMKYAEQSFWKNVLSQCHKGLIDTWDYQWVFCSWLHRRIAINPGKNLITNIGFGEAATHTIADSIYANMPTLPMRFPLSHPNFILVNHLADHFVAKGSYTSQPMYYRIVRKLLHFIMRNFTK